MIEKLLSYLEEMNPSETARAYADIVHLVARSYVKSINAELADDELDEHADDWLNEVFSNTFPVDHDLYSILGERDLLTDHENNSWDITVSLVGDACQYASEVDERLKYHYESYRLNGPDHSVDLVEDFYDDWRRSFLREVHRITSESVSHDKQILVTVSVVNDECDPVGGAIVDMAAIDGTFESSGNATDEDGKFQFLLEHCGDDPLRAQIYLNGSSRGLFEFSGSKEDVELVGS